MQQHDKLLVQSLSYDGFGEQDTQKVTLVMNAHVCCEITPYEITKKLTDSLQPPRMITLPIRRLKMEDSIGSWQRDEQSDP